MLPSRRRTLAEPTVGDYDLGSRWDDGGTIRERVRELMEWRRRIDLLEPSVMKRDVADNATDVIQLRIDIMREIGTVRGELRTLRLALLTASMSVSVSAIGIVLGLLVSAGKL